MPGMPSLLLPMSSLNDTCFRKCFSPPHNTYLVLAERVNRYLHCVLHDALPVLLLTFGGSMASLLSYGPRIVPVTKEVLECVVERREEVRKASITCKLMPDGLMWASPPI